MDALLLARLQFATTSSVHFLFVALTLGLVTFVALTQTKHVLSGKEVYGRMARFWGQLYVVNYALGIVTGIVMEFQFGMNWSGLSRVVGDVVGIPLSLETIVAFFLESTFLGLWIFGWGRLNRFVHLALIWLVLLTAYASAFFVLGANAFLQNPVGYRMDGGRAVLTGFGALMANPNMWDAFAHTVAAALLTGGLFVVGVSAYHFVRRTAEIEFFTRSLRRGLTLALAAAACTVYFGRTQYEQVIATQPGKIEVGDAAAAASATLRERFGHGVEIRPDWVVNLFNLMLLIGFVLLLCCLIGTILLFRNWFVRMRAPLYVFLALVPVPFVTLILGWIVREVGRQPWVVYGVLRTSDAFSGISPRSMLASFVVFTAVVVVLAVIDVVLLARIARRGPGEGGLVTLPGAPAPRVDEPKTYEAV